MLLLFNVKQGYEMEEREYINLIADPWIDEIPQDMEDIDLSNPSYCPKKGIVSKWTIDIRRNPTEEFYLCVLYTVPGDENEFMPILNWSVTSVVGAENFISLQLARGEDSINLIVDLLVFIFVGTHLLRRKEELPWINLEKYNNSKLERGNEICSFIMWVSNTMHHKNNKIRHENKKRRDVLVSQAIEVQDGGGSSSHIEGIRTRTPKSVPSNMRKQIVQQTKSHGRVEKISSKPGPKKKKPLTQRPTDTSPQRDTSSLTDIVVNKRRGKNLDDLESEVEKNLRFWANNESAYVFGKTWTFEVDIEKCEESPKASMVVRPREEEGVKILVKYFATAGSVNKQTICLMPKGCDKRPTMEMWETKLKMGQFWIINGQHSIEASKRLVSDRSFKDENRKNELRTWSAFFVWSTDDLQLNDISSFYNESNNFDVFSPTIVNNILHARKTWEIYGRPPKCRSNSSSEMKKPWEVSIYSSRSP